MIKFRYLTRWEKVLVIFLFIIFLASSTFLGSNFIVAHSSKVPSDGGVYSEGMVGRIQYLNPVFSEFNPIDRDISALLFSGLMKYNPETAEIEDDLATHTLDTTKKVYTFTLKENVKWHDGTPVMADDIIFTFKTVIQSADFKNNLLRENFKGVEIKKLNDKTVLFALQKPYKFFLTNLIVGILPKHLLESVPVANLDLSDFNSLNPVGTGPYKLASLSQSNGVDKVSLEKFEDFYGNKPKIQEIDFYVYPNFEQLQLSKNILDAVQTLDMGTKEFFSKSLLRIESYTLPQYVAFFFNTGSQVLSNKQTRLGLALGTDKTALLKKVPDSNKVDTPFLELKDTNWLFQYDADRAQGALNDSGWKLPWKQKIAVASSELPASAASYITLPNGGFDYATSEKDFFIEGNVPDGTKEVYVDDYKLAKFKEGDSKFSYRVSLTFASLKEGMNNYPVFIKDASGVKKALDSLQVFYSPDPKLVEEKKKEFDLVKISLEKKKKEFEDAKKAEIQKALQETNKGNIYRINEQGKILELKLITAEKPAIYGEIAKDLQKQWEKIGVKLNIEVLDMPSLQKRFSNHEYDILLFGQSLGYNLDSYPYWHSTQAEKGFNFSQLKNFKIDTLLEQIRSTHNNQKRQSILEDTQKALTDEVPAVFLYTPKYYFAISSHVKGAVFQNWRDQRDRFAHIEKWYVNESYDFNKDVSLENFFSWFLKGIITDTKKLKTYIQ